MTAQVTLVGAGPGDAGLLTLRGLRALQEADVIVADRLGARQVLQQLADEGEQIDAEVIDVGKLPGHHPVPQDGINEILVQLAREGKRVVRLKGGDPFVFGRGREEQLFCEAAGVTVDVVPGVTSAVSVPAVAGIPLTHRGVAASFTVVSAHDQIEAGGPLSLSNGDHTVVLLMGVNTLGHSAHVLAAGPRGADCPVAIIEDGFGDHQRVTIGTLGTIAHLAATRQVRSPAVIVVGDVVSLSPHASARAGRSAESATDHGENVPNPPGIVTPSADRRAPAADVTESEAADATESDAADAATSDAAESEAATSDAADATASRQRWTDALFAGLAADTGLVQAVEALDTGHRRRTHLIPSVLTR